MNPSSKVLVTGAGGFIGGRVIEALFTLKYCSIRAGIRRWASAARIGRLPVEIISCDVLSKDQLTRALCGISHVVHCAVGDRETTVDGTALLLEEARQAGVKRVVHLSTVDVYGLPNKTVVDETSEVVYTGRQYGDSKVDAEALCRDYASRGGHITILRPSAVYGPFSSFWTISLIQRMQSPPWGVAVEDSQGTCNVVYVDDVIRAIITTLGAEIGTGEVFNINGPDQLTWHQYFCALNDAAGLPALRTAGRNQARLSAAIMLPVRRVAKTMLRHFQPQIMTLYQRYDWAKRMMKRAEGAIRSTPTPDEFPIFANPARYSISKAEKLLGWTPRCGISEGISQSIVWLRRHGYLPRAT